MDQYIHNMRENAQGVHKASWEMHKKLHEKNLHGKKSHDGKNKKNLHEKNCMKKKKERDDHMKKTSYDEKGRCPQKV